MNKSKRNSWDVHRDNVRIVLEREFAYSLMNNTKWMEVLDTLHEFRVRLRVKRIFDVEHGPWTLPSGGNKSWLPVPFIDESHPFKVVDIEWMEIEPFERLESDKAEVDGAIIQTDHTKVLIKRLESLHIPFLYQDGIILIVGHQRKS